MIHGQCPRASRGKAGEADVPGPELPRPLGHSACGIHSWSKAAAPGAVIAKPEENGAVEPKEVSFVL